ncbi:MAG: glycoside hydrolase family 172 protein [Pirellulaceae bacterium]
MTHPIKDRLFPFWALAIVLFIPCASAQMPLGNPLSGLETLKDFESRRASSSDRDWKKGNADARPIQPGGTLTLAELDGPGIITHIWFTIAHDDPFYSAQLTLRMYWDGETHPSVEAPIGDFFGIGHGVDRSFMSLPVRVTSEGRARNCYWPMPFRGSAKITVTNESDKSCHAFYYYIDWQKHQELPQDTAYFHAMYRQEFPCVMGRNYLLADIQGRGHYVGTIQSVYHSSPGWYGEGDDFFYIDGAAEPQLQGTGTEDYFCDAWGFRQQDGPFYGTPLWEGYNTGDRSSAYRWHIPDPVTFKKSLRAEIEHKGSQTFPDGKGDGFIERDDLMSSVALWYQSEPHTPWPALPPGKDRLPFGEQTLAVGHTLVPLAKHSGAPLEVQPIFGATDGKQLWFRPADEQAWLELPFCLDKEITAELWVKTLHSWDYGTWRVRVDGKDAGTFDLYNASITPTSHRVGLHTLSAGEHTLRFECVGKAEASDGYLLGFDALMARVPVYTRPPDFDLRKIQVEPSVD